MTSGSRPGGEHRRLPGHIQKPPTPRRDLGSAANGDSSYTSDRRRTDPTGIVEALQLASMMEGQGRALPAHDQGAIRTRLSVGEPSFPKPEHAVAVSDGHPLQPATTSLMLTSGWRDGQITFSILQYPNSSV